LIDADKDGAIEYCKGMINDLLANRIDLSLLVITKGLSKKLASDNDFHSRLEGDMVITKDGYGTTKEKKAGGTDTYGAINSAHVNLAERMKIRDPGTAPRVGDRVSYVMIKGSKGQK
jgi:DNA polymerase delta subunit 1